MQTCPSPQQCHTFTPIFLSLITPSWNKLATPTIGILLQKIVLLDASPLLMCQMNLQADGRKANQQIQISILMFLQILSGPLIWKAPSFQFMFYTIFLKCPTECLQVSIWILKNYVFNTKTMTLLIVYPTQHLLHTHTESELLRSIASKLALSLKKTLGVFRTVFYEHTHTKTSV